MELELEWDNTAYPIECETPKDWEGGHGIFMILYDLEIAYIGKSSGNKQHVGRESKRLVPLKRYLIVKGELSLPLKPFTLSDRIEIENRAKTHCKRYAGLLKEILTDEKSAAIDSGEKLLVYLKTPKGNENLKKRYRGIRPFKLINIGEMATLNVLGLEHIYIINNNGAIFAGSDDGNLKRLH